MSPRKRSQQPVLLACLIVGKDSYLRTQQREQIIAANVPQEARAFAVAQFSLARTSLAQVLSQATMRPMLSPRQVLVLGDLDAVQDEDWALLEEYFEAPADFTVLVFEAEQLDRRTRTARLLLEICQVFDAESPNDTAAVRAAGQVARELGVKLDLETANELVFALGTNQGRLRTELEKLRAYVGAGGEVGKADLAVLVSPARQFSVFELVDLLAAGRRADALVRVRQLLQAGESPIGIVALLAWLYRRLLEARALPGGTPAWKAAQLLHAPRSRAEELLRQARQWPPEALQRALVALLDADLALKSSAPNPTAVLETLVVQLTKMGAPEEGSAGRRRSRLLLHQRIVP